MININDKNETLVKAVQAAMELVNRIDFSKKITTQNNIDYFPLNDSWGISMIVDVDIFNDPFLRLKYTKGPEKNKFLIAETNTDDVDKESIERCLKRLLKNHEKN